MKVVEPVQTIKLFLVYLENNMPVTGLIDLTVTGLDRLGNVILDETALGEKISPDGEYFYMWNVNNSNLLDKFVNIYYKKGSEILDIEEFYFQLLEDMDGVAS